MSRPINPILYSAWTIVLLTWTFVAVHRIHYTTQTTWYQQQQSSQQSALLQKPRVPAYDNKSSVNYTTLPAWSICDSHPLELVFDDLSLRLLIFETHYSYSEGIMSMHAILMETDQTKYTVASHQDRVWWRAESYTQQIELARSRLSCSLGVGAEFIPLDKFVRINDNSFELRCPYLRYPYLPPPDATPMILTLKDRVALQTTSSSSTSLCAV